MKKETDIILSLFFRDFLNFLIHDFIFNFLVFVDQPTLVVGIFVVTSKTTLEEYNEKCTRQENPPWNYM